MTPEQARIVAAKIAEDLFTNGRGDRADRLWMMDADQVNIGGWSEAAVEKRIADALIASEASHER